MSPAKTFVIIGAGLAGAKAAQALRDQGFDGRLVLIGDEPDQPYERPPLSKAYLAGRAEADDLLVHKGDWYASHDVDLRLGTHATSIDRVGRRVVFADDSEVNYDKLLLTTGASPRKAPVPGASANGVHYLRRRGDADALADTLATVSNLVVIGAGWIGLEVTAAARAAGVEVTIVEAAELPLLRVLGREVAEVFAALHQRHDVDFRFRDLITEVTTANGRATGIRLRDGTRQPADAVLVAVGAAPNTELAEAADLRVDNGILVDATLRTSDPDIVAAGDVANAFHPMLSRHIRVEHWANALNQPATAATAMLGGAGTYDALPYFYTDQYDLGMEYT
ncbi:MAG: NAD(P)/FAD-dependent oxidoreductase, partial [Sciscionella sp.]